MTIFNPTQVDWTRPGAIGLVTPNTVKATTFNATGIVTTAEEINMGANTSAYTAFTLNGAGNANKQIYWKTNGVLRWDFGIKSSTSEPGNNTGSDLFLRGWNDLGNSVVTILTATRLGALTITGTTSFTNPVKFAAYTVATVPSASANTAGTIYVSNELGGATPAFSDGTNWRRVHDRAIIS
jgi:hypothetical protein